MNRQYTIGKQMNDKPTVGWQTAARLGIVVGALLWPHAVHGQVLPRDIADLTLEELLNVHVTTATKISERSTVVPAHVEVVTADTIRARGYRSLPDLLRDLPDFKVDFGTDPDRPSDVTVQGTRGTSRVIILLDGVRISSPTNEPLPILGNYPVYNARQVEIVYGPGSALYGADAFSAVVNIISKDAAAAKGLTLTMSAGQFGLGNVSGSYGVQLREAVSLVISAQGLVDRQPDLSRYYPDDFKGLTGQHSGTFSTIFGPMTPDRPVPSAYSNPLSAHSMHAVLQAGALHVMLFESQSRVPTSPAYTPDNAVYSNEAFNENHLLVGAVSHSRAFGTVTSTSTLTMSQQEIDPQSGYRNVYSNMEKSFKYAYGSRISAEQQLSWKANQRLTITAGSVFDHLFSIPQGADLNAPIVSRDQPGTILDTTIVDDYYKIRSSNLGVYGQGQFALTPMVTVTLGLRFDDNNRYENATTPRIGVVWQPSPRTTVKLLHGTAFLAPSPNQAYAHYGSFSSADGGKTYTSSFWHLPNPDLRPERRRTEELDVQQGVGEQVSIWGSMFYSRFKDLVQEGQDRDARYAGFFHGWPVDFIEISVNDGREDMWGGSAGVKTVKTFGANRRIVGELSISLADGYVTSTDSTVKREVAGMTPVQLHAAMEMSLGNWSIAPRVVLIGNQRAVAIRGIEGGVERRQTLDGSTTLDINVRRQQLFKGVDAFITVENALDARYRNLNLRAFSNPEELIGAPQNPRRLTVGVELRIP